VLLTIASPMDQYLAMFTAWAVNEWYVWIAFGFVPVVVVVAVAIHKARVRARARVPQYRRRGRR